ncbi:uncharacterized protein [Fopius arisanus]|uniref:BTB domain-containing protein n=2 Tax=Fopius arisanus TaxID=64838 RepID=A0A9R1TPL7_9HYME|nr:PREDICTED: uncharacterized protein LOC105272224 [Fopius arisanus]
MGDPEENRVILVLNGTRVPAQRDKLIKYSRYFSALFSENFKDHQQDEQPINFSVSLNTLKDFISWTEETKEKEKKLRTHKVESCMEKFKKNRDFNAFELLDLSVVLLCDKLTNDLTSTIILHWMTNENILHIWTIAEALGLDKLRDVALGACLDRFEDIPIPFLLQLDLENFMKLVGSANIKCAKDWLRIVCRKAATHYSSSANHDPSSHLYKSLMDILKPPHNICPNCSNNGPNYVSCVVAYKSLEGKPKIPCVYWWKNSKFSELVDLQDIARVMDHGTEVFGRQVIGRGFNIYVIGGERGLGSGRFLKTIWRYCLLTHTWFSFAELPRARRHMVAAFIKNKLYLAGGIGQHRLQLSSVDVLDIYSGEWSTAARIPEKFAETPPYSVVDGMLIYFKTHFYSYHPATNAWVTLKINFPDDTPIIHIDSLMGYEHTPCANGENVYVGIADPDKPMTRLFSFPVHLLSGKLTFISEQSYHFPRQIFNGSMLFSFSCTDGRVKIERGTFEDINIYQFVGIRSTVLKGIHESGFQSRFGCFNVIDPDSIHQQASFTDHGCMRF